MGAKVDLFFFVQKSQLWTLTTQPTDTFKHFQGHIRKVHPRPIPWSTNTIKVGPSIFSGPSDPSGAHFPMPYIYKRVTKHLLQITQAIDWNNKKSTFSLLRPLFGPLKMSIFHFQTSPTGGVGPRWKKKSPHQLPNPSGYIFVIENFFIKPLQSGDILCKTPFFPVSPARIPSLRWNFLATQGKSCGIPSYTRWAKKKESRRLRLRDSSEFSSLV